MPGEGIGEVSDTASKITEEGLAAISAQLLPVGTVLFSSRATIGKLGISRVPLATNQGFANFIPRKGVDAKYLAYCLLHFTNEIAALAGSTTFKEVTKTSLKKYRIPLPPLSEQRRIVEILDQADALRKKRAEADAKAARILPALFYNMFGDPATNPKGWPVKRLGDPRVATINPKFSGDNVSADTEVSFVPMADVDEIWGRIVGKQVRKYSDVMRGFTPFRDGDVLFAKITPCMQNGKTAIARNLVNGLGFGSTEFHVLRAGPLVTPEWLFALVRLAWFRRQAESSFTGTAGQQRVPADFLARYEIGCPPIDLQRKFAKAVVHIQEWVHQKDRSRKGIEDLFAVLLHSAFTGDLTAKWREAHMKELLAEMEEQAKILQASSEANQM
jgi:type I restriction enzyme S subunit